MPERARQTWDGYPLTSDRRPATAPGQATSENTDIASVKFATANGTTLRLSSVFDGRNGARIQPSPSAMIPKGQGQPALLDPPSIVG
jgi:hypothetical protein